MFHASVTFLLISIACAASPNPETFANPEFRGQDPWITRWESNYYYSESNLDAITIRKSATLTGVAHAIPQEVWRATGFGSNRLTNIWAPEVHVIDGRWYIYFSADHGGDKRRRMYVLQGGFDPLDAYSPGNTGLPGGIIAESTGLWAIDPDVFYGADGKLYVTWSCAEDETGGPPQSLCLARMADPLHIATATAKISSPETTWERRTAAIQEGPVGFARNTTTYLTYSAGASWTTNDYSVGLLTHTSGDLLNPGTWVKSGQIFDHHAGTYGPGSVVFVSSPDGTETWNVYHAYDQLNCPAWGCRSIRMQKVSWSVAGMPLLGYPVDPYVQASLPSGDVGSATGWGDSTRGTYASGDWAYYSSSSLDSKGFSRGVDDSQTFRGGERMLAWSVSAEVSEQQHTADAQTSEYGLFALFVDARNYVQAYIDPVLGVFGVRAFLDGKDSALVSLQLPADFDASAAHTIRVEKSGARLFSFFVDNVLIDSKIIPLDHGQVGVYTRRTDAQFRSVSVVDRSFGWGDAQGDSAEGFPELSTGSVEDGYAHGEWELTGESSAASTDAGSHTLYRENPSWGNYRVRMEVQSASSYGLIVCHDDRNNQLILFLDPVLGAVELMSVIQGVVNSRRIATLDDFDMFLFHKVAAQREGNLFTFFIDDAVVGAENAAIGSGTVGVASREGRIQFRGFFLDTSDRIP